MYCTLYLAFIVTALLYVVEWLKIVIKQLIYGISVFESGGKIKCVKRQTRYQTVNLNTQIIKHSLVVVYLQCKTHME